MFSVTQIIESLRSLIPDLSEDQVTQIESICNLAFGGTDAVGEIPGVTPEMRSYFGLEDAIDPWKAMAGLDEVLSAIQKIVPLDEEQLEKVAAIFQLAVASSAAEESAPMEDDLGGEEFEDDMPLEDDLGDEEFEEGEEFEEEGDEEDIEEEIRSIVDEAVDEVFGPNWGRRSASPMRRPTRAVARFPPYQFTPRSQDDGGSDMRNPRKAAARMYYGETGPAIKAVAAELYGVGYDMKRYEQAQAFGRFLRGGAKALSTKQERALKGVILTPNQIKAFTMSGMEVRQLKADMSDIIDQLGGFLVPEDFRLDMIERLPGLTVVRRHAEVLQTGSDMMTRVKVTGGDSRYTGAVRVTWVGDVPAAAGADTRPSYGLERTPVHIAKGTVHIPMSLLEDTPFPLVQKISEWVAEAYSIDEDEQFLVGNGIAKPEGILPSQANGRSLAEAISGSGTTLTFDGLLTLKYAVKRQYRQAGTIWIMNDQTAMTAAKLKDGDGRYLWENSTQEDEPDKLLGSPVETSEAMPDIAADAYPILYGNLKQGYQIADRIGMSVTRDDLTQAEEDLVKFIFRRRLGGQVRQEVAMAVQKISAT